MIDKLKSEYDLDGDGKVLPDELLQSKELLELELREEKAEAQKRMSWLALSAMVIITLLLLSPFIGTDRVTALANLMGMFYLACASIVGFYFGATAYMSK